MSKPSPVLLTKKWWEARGGMFDIAERHIRAGRRVITKDLFGVIDVVVLDKEFLSPILIQVTSSSHHSNRRKKLLDSEVYSFCKANEIEVYLAVQSWYRRKADKLWVTRIEMWEPFGTFPQSPLEYRGTYNEKTEEVDDGN